MKNLTDLLLHNKLIRSFGIYTIAKVINSCIPFFLLPILTKYLNPGEYGITSMIITVSSFVMPIVTLKIEDAVVRRYYYDERTINIYLWNSISIVLIMTAITNISMLFISNYLASFTEIPYYIYYFLPAFCLLSFFKTVFLYYLQVRQKATYFGVYSIMLTLLEFGTAILLVVYLDMGWKGQALAMLVGALIAAIYAIVYMIKNNLIKIKYDKKSIIHAINYGSWLIPAGIGGASMIMANRMFLTKMVSIEETGLYGVATSFAGLIAFVTVSFNNAFVPWLFPKLNKNDENIKKKIVKVSYAYMLGLFLLVFVIYYFVKLIIPIFINERFYSADKHLLWLLIGYAFQGCYFMVTNYIMYVEKTKYTTYITIISGLLSVLLNYTLISIIGAVGASVAFAITFMLFFIFTWILSAKLYSMPWISFNSKKE